MIEFHDVTKRYPNGHEALRGVSLRVESGAMAFLTGHSGAGKSTLLRLTTLLERATRGQVLVGGHNLNRMRRGRIPYFRRNIGVVFQNHRLLTDRTVFDNVALPLVIAGHGHGEIARRVRAALDKVGLLDKARAFPVTLSGGEQQRVGIARAVVHRPRILLADEPTGNLDPQLSREIMGLFESFNQVGVTVLIATHDISLIENLGYDILTLEHGSFVHGSRTAH
ncbi:MAG: cell division ATP-binding protein FtsE [Gammaproteobacteria bacterium]|nr:cell division ATP-binding protein FtsE [Gammaproteobacteria bacterium]